jgi:hypothetical protein
LRVTSWLAGWVDYMFALVLVAGRWLRLPLASTEPDAGFRTAFAPTIGDSFGQNWHDSQSPQQSSGPLVKAAEIVMLSISFFLAAHLISGGTATASAPNLTVFRNSERPEAQSTLVASVPALEITVPAGSFTSNLTEPEATAEPENIEAATLQPPAAEAAAAAAVQQPAPPAEPTAAPKLETAAPPPAPAAAVAPPATEPTVVVPAGRYLSTKEVRGAALAAGWPVALVDDVVNVAWCESRFQTHALYGGAQGLMQMMPFWFTSAGLDPNLWSDPVTNMKAALFAYQEHERDHVDPWGPWTCKPNHGLPVPD